MVSLTNTLPFLGYLLLLVSIGIRKALKVITTLREDPHNRVQIALQVIPKLALDKFER
jgi:hypothetical protein